LDLDAVNAAQALSPGPSLEKDRDPRTEAKPPRPGYMEMMNLEPIPERNRASATFVEQEASSIPRFRESIGSVASYLSGCEPACTPPRGEKPDNPFAADLRARDAHHHRRRTAKEHGAARASMVDLSDAGDADNDLDSSIVLSELKSRNSYAFDRIMQEHEEQRRKEEEERRRIRQRQRSKQCSELQ